MEHEKDKAWSEGNRSRPQKLVSPEGQLRHEVAPHNKLLGKSKNMVEVGQCRVRN
jgi:hypothetical protein